MRIVNNSAMDGHVQDVHQFLINYRLTTSSNKDLVTHAIVSNSAF